MDSTHEVEVIDLTVAPPSSTAPTQDAPTSSKRKRGRRRSEIQSTSRLDTPDDAPNSPAEDDLFFFDTTPVPLPTIPPAEEVKEQDNAGKLLLPAHVSVFGLTPVEILAPPPTAEDDTIQFLDYDDGKVWFYLHYLLSNDSDR